VLHARFSLISRVCSVFSAKFRHDQSLCRPCWVRNHKFDRISNMRGSSAFTIQRGKENLHVWCDDVLLHMHTMVCTPNFDASCHTCVAKFDRFLDRIAQSAIMRPIVADRVAWSVCPSVCHSSEPCKNG